MTQPEEITTERPGEGEPLPEALPKTEPAKEPRPARGSELRPSIVTIAAVSIGLHLIAKVSPAVWTGSWTRVVASLLVGFGFCLIWWTMRRFLFRTLTSLPFAATILVALALSTVLGTLIVQGAHPDEYAQRFGTTFAPLIQWLGLNDIFRAAWFNGMIALMALSLVFVIVKHRAWRLPQWGHLLAHAGVIVVLIGAVVGNLTGFRGFIDIHEGEVKSEATRMDRGTRLPETHELDFAIRLDRFEVEHYEKEYRLYIYERAGDSFRAVRSLSLDEARSSFRAGREDAELRLTNVFPDFGLRSELEAAPAGVGGITGLRVELPGRGERSVSLLAGTPGRTVVDLTSVNGPMLGLVDKEPRAEDVERWQEARGESHVVAFSLGQQRPEDLRVVVGEDYALGEGGHRMRVLEYLPDFAYDTESRRAFSRTEEPNNPALRVALSQPGTASPEVRWLIANAPDFDREHGRAAAGPRLIYRHVPERSPLARELLVIAETKELWEIEHGRVVGRHTQPLEGEAVELAGGSKLTLFPSAHEVHEPFSRSEDWKNPVVEVELREGGKIETHHLPAEHSRPLYLAGDQTVVLFAEKPDAVSAFRSDLVVIEEGEEVAAKTIAVNHPLYYRGYHFYQSNYRQDDPTYSGILVVKDRGLIIVWIGFLALSFGLIFIYYVRPRLVRRASS